MYFYHLILEFKIITMKKISTYSLVGEEKILEQIAVVSDSEKIQSRIVYRDGQIESEASYEYNEKDQLVRQRETTVEGLSLIHI